MTFELPERFWSKTREEDHGYKSPCLTWTASLNEQGYGRFKFDGTVHRAHRLAYQALVGPIPDGLQLDHLCRNRACVNVEHLEPVTARANVLRGTGFAARNSKVTHCPEGHEYTPENTYVQPGTGQRECRTCRYARQATGAPHPGKRTHCPQGHPYDEANTRMTKAGFRACRVCGREHSRKTSRARRAHRKDQS
ncbi:HNH endonuclease signature motif containing protein [Streptomyces sp. NPDC005248]|uniref:HNH endonuclease signature motif containing protein n=1 Tax=Streptomyces sp. NPDC005248 TaxID=3364709 RepID=UPI003697D39C